MVFHAFDRCMLTSHSVDKMLLTRYVILMVFHGFVRCMLTSHSVDKMLLTRYVTLMLFHAFVRCMLTSHSVDKMLLTRYVILMVFYAFVRCMLTSYSVDKMLLTRYVILLNFRPASSSGDGFFLFKNHVLCCIPVSVESDASCFSSLNRENSAVVLARSARSSAYSASAIISTGCCLLSMWNRFF